MSFTLWAILMPATPYYEGRYSVIGPPGTGKTTFLADRTARSVEAGDTVCLCSLTTAAAREILRRNIPVPPEAVGTLHAHAYRAIGRPKVISKADIDEWNEQNPAWRMSGIDTASDMVGTGREQGDVLLRRLDLCRHRQTPEQSRPTDVVGFGALWAAWKDERDVVDFTDMIELALQETRSAPESPNVIMADEAQDLSRLEYNLLSQWARWARAMIVVGDPDQALFCWRGADPTIFRDPIIPDEHRGVLEQSYRVPREVHRVATAWIKRLTDYQPIEYLPRDADGAVHACEATAKYPEPMVTLAQRHLDAGQSVMILASANYLLHATLHVLRREAIPFSNPWRVTRGDWNPLVQGSTKRVTATDRVLSWLRPTEGVEDVHDEWCPYCAGHRITADGTRCEKCFKYTSNPRWSHEDVARWLDPLASKGTLATGAKTAVAQKLRTFMNREACFKITDEEIMLLADPQCAAWLRTMNAGSLDIPEAVTWYMQHLLVSRSKPLDFPLRVAEQRGLRALTTPPKLYVGTIHSVKGGEADVVFVLPDISYAAWRAMDTDEGKDAVTRMFYVAATRARETLYLCSPGTRMAVQIAA